MIIDTINDRYFAFQQKHTLWRYCYTSFIAHSISRTIFAPLERVKILMQSQNSIINDQLRYQSTSEAFQRIYKEQGLASFWRGNLTNIYRVIPQNFLKFAAYNHFKDVFLSQKDKQYYGYDLLLRNLLLGVCSVFFIQLAIYPFETVRMRQICDQKKYFYPNQFNGFSQCLYKIFKKGGIQQLYKGFFITNICIMPYLVIAYTLQDLIKSQYPTNTQKFEVNTFIYYFGVAGVSALISSLITYPFDTIKRRNMMSGIAGFEKQYKGLFNCINIIYQREGMKGFYGGFTANLFKIVPCLYLQFSIYDNSRILCFE
ncbi:solute carrier family protein, putative [Ichthyophthirius multifiliis]|uniref:Solute carrier family protein, putative n=1 Tax=Ichthyophthirius multifiliis TaxID=5932 RepID=G0QPT4_ICHMU|nr:solute carrier family protein, putative [Ichthyophthirius multifiliis]EGR32799.1 solute carrier family protein, putative [Ichthyophthirius multifiliis]|eukprot:XP_004036785.1 solute carrier family protein, putative [Ichthyophthirius multifiliis]